MVRITNLKNSKSLDTKIYKKAKYPKIFNVLISKKIASILELDHENPYVEILELKQNKTYFLIIRRLQKTTTLFVIIRRFRKTVIFSNKKTTFFL